MPSIASSFAFVVLGLSALSCGVFDPTLAQAAEMSDRELSATAIEVYNELATEPLPFLSAEQLDDLVEGEVVRVRDRTSEANEEGDRPERVVGYRLIAQPRLHVWLAALDPAFQASDLLTEVRLEQTEDGASVWYQHLSLPWPVSDRHWVIRLDKGLDLQRETQGLIWEQRWDLAIDGPALAAQTVASGRAGELTTEKVAKAIYLPVNEGAWTLFALDEELTLLAYRVRTVVGGSIPEGWITTFAMAQLNGLLEGVVRHSEEAWREYDAQAWPVYDGVGKLIDSPVAAQP